MSNIVELFSGIQGEGTIVGFRQIFVRFAQCQLNCHFCDTDFQVYTHASIETIPGKRVFESWENPIDAERLVEHILSMNAMLRHHSVSITGGEPLLHYSYLANVLPRLRMRGLPVYLETNGLLHRELSEIIDSIDMIAMDIKLESTTKQATQWVEHERFLSVARGKNVSVKLVVGDQTTEREIEQAARMISETAQEAALIIQPVTPTRDVSPPSPERLIAFMDIALGVMANVRVIPQTHVMLNQL